MPEMQFAVRWPDESVTDCYSPSLVVRDYLEVGTTYALDDFVDRVRTALTIASERVEAKYGYPCANALAQLAIIERTAERFTTASPGGRVRVEAFSPDEDASARATPTARAATAQVRVGERDGLS